MDPHVFMQIFLPSLIFYSVFSINYHTIMRLFWQAFFLAVPGNIVTTHLRLGVLLNAVLTSLPFVYVIP